MLEAYFNHFHEKLYFKIKFHYFILLFWFHLSTSSTKNKKPLSLSLSLWLSTWQGKLNKPWGRLIEGPGHYLTQIKKGRVVMKRCVDRLLYIIMPNDYRLFKYILKKYICRTRHHSELKNNFDYKKKYLTSYFFRKKVLFKESSLSIMVTRNPNWTIKILWYGTSYVKGKILSLLKRSAWDRLHCWFCLKLLNIY